MAEQYRRLSFIKPMIGWVVQKGAGNETNYGYRSSSPK
jgi:hypothetical protein